MNCNFKRTTILKAYLYHLLASLPFVSFKKHAEKQNNAFVLVFNAITGKKIIKCSFDERSKIKIILLLLFRNEYKL